MPDGLITGAELAEELGTTRERINHLRTRHDLPCEKHGSSYWYDRGAVLAWFDVRRSRQ